MGDKLGMKSTKEREDPNFMCKTFMTSFRITNICGSASPAGPKPRPTHAQVI